MEFQAMLNLGAVGFGARAQHMFGLMQKIDPGARLASLVEPAKASVLANRPEAAEATWYDDVTSMLDGEKLDGVLVSTPNSYHVAAALPVIERGIPLFLEKPVVTTREDLKTLKAAGHQLTAPVIVSFPLRLAALTRKVRQLIKEDTIGEIQHIQAVNNVPSYGVIAFYHGWRRNEALSGGLWLEKATHDLDILNYLTGLRPIEVAGMESKTVFRGTMPAGLKCVDCSQVKVCSESPVVVQDREGPFSAATLKPDEWRCVFGVDTGNHDSGTAIVRYETGIHAMYSQNFYSRRSAATRGATVIGHKGTLRFDWYRAEIELIDHFDTTTARWDFIDDASGHFGGDKQLASSFMEAAAGLVPPSSASLNDGLLSAELGLSIDEACKTGRTVTVRHDGF
jgi:predicted dehydrogenase